MLMVVAPREDWAWIWRLAAPIQEQATSVRHKVSRLQHSSDLVALGHQLMVEAEETKMPALRRAEHYRDGLLIALLALRPLRLRNLASIEVGRHLMRNGAGYHLAFAARETKNRRVLEHDIPPELIPHLQRYLDHYRKLLLTCGGRYEPVNGVALWISREGNPMPEVSIRGAVQRRTQAAFGAPLPPHWFRDAAATTLATDDPEHVLAAASLLGNRPATMMKYYNQAQSFAADRRYQAVLAEFKVKGR
jgi:integrase